MTLPELSRDERAALAFLLRTAAKFGPEKCWPKIYSIGVAIGKKRRTVTTILTSLVAFGIIERIERGCRATRYRILLNSEQLNSIFCVAFRNDCAAYCAAMTNSSKVKEMTLVKARKSRAICAASPSLCPPTPPKETTMQMPDFLTLPSEQKLWRMAQRWITENKPPLITGLDVGPIMMQLEGAGALDLAEDAPLPEIVWPPQLARDRILASQVMTNEANRDTRRKPMQKADGDLRTLQRRVNGTE